MPTGYQKFMRGAAMLTVGAVVVFAIALFLSACGSTSTSTTATSPDPRTVTVTDADNNGSVQLNPGDTLEVTLTGNPTTGYQWQQTDPKASVLAQAGEPAFTPDSSAIGSPGKVTLRFEAVGPGQMQLQLIYHRSFEPNTPPAETFTLAVTVGQVGQSY